MYFVPPQKWHFQQNGGCVEQRSGDNFINKNALEKRCQWMSDIGNVAG